MCPVRLAGGWHGDDQKLQTDYFLHIKKKLSERVQRKNIEQVNLHVMLFFKVKLLYVQSKNNALMTCFFFHVHFELIFPKYFSRKV